MAQNAKQEQRDKIMKLTIWENSKVQVSRYNAERYYKNLTCSSRERLENLIRSGVYHLSARFFDNQSGLAVWIWNRPGR